MWLILFYKLGGSFLPFYCKKKAGWLVRPFIKSKRVPFTIPSFEIKMLLSFYTDLTTMSLIWICFNKLGFTLLTAAVSFRLGLIFRTVLPVFPFTPATYSVFQPSLPSIRFLHYSIRFVVCGFLQNHLLTNSRLYQVSISNDFSFNFYFLLV